MVRFNPRSTSRKQPPHSNEPNKTNYTAKVNKGMDLRNFVSPLWSKTKRIRVQRFVEEVSMLLCLPCVDNLNLPVGHAVPKG